MKTTDLQDEVLNIIQSYGKTNPITGRQVAAKLDIVDRDRGKVGAAMRSIVNALRTKGFPICASGRGYWYPHDKEELDEFIESFQARINKQQVALNGIKNSRENVDKSIEDIRKENGICCSKFRAFGRHADNCPTVTQKRMI